MDRRRRPLLWLLTGLLTVCATRSPAAPTPDLTPLKAQPMSPLPKSGPAQGQAVRTSERAWWNQPEVIAALHLKDEQRTKMDAQLASALETQRTIQQSQAAQMKAFVDALVKCDWDAARRAAASVRDDMEKLWMAQTNLKIDVLTQLDATQRQTLAAQYRQLLRQPSVLWGPGQQVSRPTPTAPSK